MPIKDRPRDNLPVVQLRAQGVSSYDIWANGEEVGGLDFTVDFSITKEVFFEQFEGHPFVKKLMKAVPENYKFNFYYLDEIILWTKNRGSGIGGIALQKWFTMLKAPACVGLVPAKIGNVPYVALLRFYKRNGFKLFKFKGSWYGITFVKHPSKASFVGDQSADSDGDSEMDFRAADHSVQPDEEEGNLDWNTTDPTKANNGGTPFFNDSHDREKYNADVTASIRRAARVISVLNRVR